jgi:hypothetical protein
MGARLKEDVAMSETEKTQGTAADAPLPTPPGGESAGDLHARADADTAKARSEIDEERAKAAELEARLDKLEAEVRPERPEPEHVDQAIGT